MTPPELVALREAASEAKRVHDEKVAAFDSESKAAVRLLALAVAALMPAFDAVSVRVRFFEAELIVALVGALVKKTESQKLYLTRSGTFLEASYTHQDGEWVITGLANVQADAVVERYEVEKVVAEMTRLSVRVATGNAVRRTREAQARAKRLREFAAVLESIGGGK